MKTPSVAGLCLYLVMSCGPVARQIAKAPEQSQVFPDVSGSVSSFFGQASDLAGWHLLLLDRATNTGRLSLVAANGGFSFKKVDPARQYTLVLLTPDQQFSAMLSARESGIAGVLSYFTITGSTLPNLVHRGLSLDFGGRENITLASNIVSPDANQNGTIDGLEAVWASLLADDDLDGLPQEFDLDDDQDGIPDFFDSDSNGDAIEDVLGKSHDDHWSHWVEQWTASLERNISPDGATSSYYIAFQAQTVEGTVPSTVRVQGPASILTGAMTLVTDDAGTVVEQPWNGQLLDDGRHFDRVAGDGLYGAKLRISGTSLPRSMHALFLLVTVPDPAGEPAEVAFSRLLPDTALGEVTLTHDNAALLTRTGEPFETRTEYTWSVLMYDAAGGLVFASDPLSSQLTTFQIPAQIRPTDQVLSYKSVFSSVPRVPSMPALVIHSALQVLTLE